MLTEKEMMKIARLTAQIMQGVREPVNKTKTAQNGARTPGNGKSASVSTTPAVNRNEKRPPSGSNRNEIAVPQNDNEKGVFYARVSSDGRLRLSCDMFTHVNLAGIGIKNVDGEIHFIEQQGESNGFRGRMQGSSVHAEPGDIVRFTHSPNATKYHYLATIHSETVRTAKGQGAQTSARTSAKPAETTKQTMKPKTKTVNTPVLTLADILALPPAKQLQALAQLKKQGQQTETEQPKTRTGKAKTGQASARTSAKPVFGKPSTYTRTDKKQGWVEMDADERKQYRAEKAERLENELGQLISEKVIPAARENRKAYKAGDFELNDRYEKGDVRRYLSGSIKKEFNQAVYRVLKNENVRITNEEARVKMIEAAKRTFTLAFPKTTK